MKMIRSRIIRNSALLCIGLMSLPVSASASSAIIANEEPDMEKITRARRIIAGLQHDLEKFTEKGSGPFVAAVYDGDGKLVAKMPNTVVVDKCSHNHAEMNAIRAAEEKLGTHDLTPFNMKLYVTAEPCSMCLGGIMWSGIKEVYYGVPSDSVEKITGFDEGYKPGWLEAFKKRGIIVYGNIELELGEQALRNYMAKGGEIYQPKR
jgi:tRNA(Arg) A34 adenosine deaminase TadA